MIIPQISPPTTIPLSITRQPQQQQQHSQPIIINQSNPRPKLMPTFNVYEEMYGCSRVKDTADKSNTSIIRESTITIKEINQTDRGRRKHCNRTHQSIYQEERQEEERYEKRYEEIYEEDQYCTKTCHPILQLISPKEPSPTQNHKKLTHQLSKKYKTRKENKANSIKNIVQQQIIQHLFDTEGTKIKIERDDREEKVKQFLKRQHFMNNERKILRQMEEYCKFGKIRG